MKILLTGASGLLGSQLAVELGKYATLVPAGHSRPANGSGVRIDITDPDTIARVVDGQGFTHIVHPAAMRSPEECNKDTARAYMVNTIGVENIAAACLRNRLKLVSVSTDFVFAGTNPPYREDSPFGPINLYGRTKLAGEFAARQVPDHLVVRIPILWGLDKENATANLKDILDRLRLGKPFPVENVLVRHFALANDIAQAIAFCLRKDLAGTVHLAPRERQTKADFARAVARQCGFDPSLVENGPIPGDAALRPQDPSLDPGYYESLGGPVIRGLSEAIKELR